MDRLGERRVGVAGGRDLAGGRLEGHARAPISAISSVAPCADEVRADDLAVARLGEDLREARGVRRGDRLAGRREREAPTRRSSPYLARASLLGEPDPRDLRLARRCRPGCGADRARALRRPPANSTAGDRPPRSPCARAAARREVADRGDRGRARAQRRVDLHEALRVERDARGFETEVRAERAAADRDEHLIGLELLARPSRPRR